MPRMTRRSNPTGLGEIANKNLQINLLDLGHERQFSLARLELSGRSIPNDARVICVARSGSSSLRYDLGRVDSWDRAPRSLADLDASAPLSFRVLIRPSGSSRLLASAENVRLRDQAQGESLIPIEIADLGQLAWRLDLDGDSGPILLVNRSVYPSAAIAENDAQFVALVLPEAVRQVCESLAEDPDGLEDESDWRFQWVDWLTGLGVQTPPPEQEDALERWCADIVMRFCNRHMFCSTLERQRDAAGEGS